MHASCAARHHAYEPKPAGPGSVCKRCGKAWQPPIGRNSRTPAAASVTTPAVERPPGDSAPMPPGPSALPPPVARGPGVASADDAALLAAALGAAPPAAALASPPETALAPPHDPARSFWTPIGKRVTKAYVAILESVYEGKGREAGEPDPEEIEKMGAALGELAATWFGNVELSPGKQVLVSAGFIAGEMWANGRPMKKPERAGSAEEGTTNARPS